MWFGRRKSECPVAAQGRPWFDASARWLVRAFGEERIRDATVVVPEPLFFPGQYDASKASIERLFVTVCGYMGVDPALIDLDVYAEEDGGALFQRLGLTGSFGGHAGTAGVYHGAGRPKILIEASAKRRLPERIATMAHEIGHYLLLGEKRLKPDYKAGEPLTDMTVAFLGLGVFGANSYFHDEQWSGGGMEGWSVGRLGYLDASQWAYSLALFAWFRKETDPPWAKHLRGDIRTPFKQGLRYLAESGLPPGELPAPPSSVDEPPLSQSG